MPLGARHDDNVRPGRRPPTRDSKHARRKGKPFTGVLTGNAEADEIIQGMVTSGGEPWDTAVAKMYEANDNTFALPANPADAEFKSALQDAVNSVLNGQATPEEAMATAQETAQSALDEAWTKLEIRAVTWPTPQ